MEGNLLIVEDKDSTRAALCEYMEREGFTVAVARDGVEALAMLDQSLPDLIVLDVVLPHVDGLDVCREVRRRAGQSIGIIMISGVKKEAIERAVGLEVGADVYMTKPVETRVLLAQVRALLRRMRDQSAQERAGGWFVADDHLRIHFAHRQVEAGERPVHLTKLEFDLLQYLAQRPGQPCSRTQLLEDVWPPGQVYDGYDQAVNTCVARLRAKIEPDPANPRYILAVHGIGYRFGSL